MGAESTLWVSRRAAMNWLARHAFGSLSDDTLREMLDHAFRDRLRNFRVGTSDADDEELEELTAL